MLIHRWRGRLYVLGLGLTLSLLLGQGLLAQPPRSGVPAVDSIQGARVALADSLLGLQLAPLDTLIERAVQRAASLRGQTALIESRKAALRVEKKSWTRLIQPYAGVAFGTGTILANVDDGTATSVNLATRQQLLYNVGLNLRFTGDDWLNRRNRCEVIEYQVEQLRHERRALVAQLRERVIMRYEALLKAAEVLQVKAQQRQSHALNWELAQRYFEAGDMSYADYNGVLNDKLHAHMQFLNVKSDFQLQYRLLQELVGSVH